MDSFTDLKALYIVVNAGFADEIVSIARSQGAGGATILNARGDGGRSKPFLGITIDSEKEMVICLVEKEVALKVMEAVQEKAGRNSPAHGFCFLMPIENMTALYNPKVDKA